MVKIIGGGRIERIATKNSIRSLVLGKENSEEVPLHLLPSACLTVNMSRSIDFIEAHRIHQWWRPDFHGQSRLYRFRGISCKDIIESGKEEEKKIMTDKRKDLWREDFWSSGPQHLTKVDWNERYHRRCVAACLVQGVKVLERDRQAKRAGERALASSWWDFFHFKLTRQILDDEDYSVSGAIYEYKSEESSQHSINFSKAPKYVIAFRGTILKLDSVVEDIWNDAKIVLTNLHKSSRVKRAKEAVDKTINSSANIWLAGHSLGAAIAMVAGKYMARKNYLIETYLFNPPFPGAPIEQIKNQTVKSGIRILYAGFTVGVAAIADGFRNKPKNDPFVGLYEWKPNLFVNRIDNICCEYIGYFKHGKWMCDIGAGEFQNVAIRNNIVSSVVGVLGQDSEPVHLLPSAKLYINPNPSQNFKQAHGIHQWWGSNTSNWEPNLYQFRN